MSVEDAVRNSYLAQGLSEEHLQALYNIAHFRTFSDGEPILRQFEDSRDLFILAKGRAHICTVVGEPIGVVKAGMPIGEISFLDERPRSVSVLSSGVSEAVEFPFKPLRALLDQHPDMENTFLRNISKV